GRLGRARPLHPGELRRRLRRGAGRRGAGAARARRRPLGVVRPARPRHDRGGVRQPMTSDVLAFSRPAAPARLSSAAAPVLIATALAAAYLAAAPMSADLAAQTYRAALFDRAGFMLWDNAWYGGHPLPGYSVLFPPLGALLGVRLVGALSAVAAAALFGALVR